MVIMKSGADGESERMTMVVRVILVLSADVEDGGSDDDADNEKKRRRMVPMVIADISHDGDLTHDGVKIRL